MASSFSSDFLTRPGLRVLLCGRNAEALLPILREFPIRLVEAGSGETPELVISSGGDGSLLGAERDYPGIPKFAIRDRANNPKCPLHGEREQLERLFRGELCCDFLWRILATSEEGEVLCGVNDVVIARQVHLGAIRYRIWANGNLLRAQVISDSLVVCTPFGSTGYFQSITHGNFRTGLGLAFNNAMEGESFTVLESDTRLEVEVLRGPASVMADNNPHLWNFTDGARVRIRLDEQRTPIFGLDAFRCKECYLLRRDGMK